MADIPKQDNALSKLFSPIQIGNLQVKNRLAMAPIGTVYSSLDGALRREFKDFILARAKGGVGMIMPGERDYVIGDAAKPRNAIFAVREGAEIGRKI